MSDPGDVLLGRAELEQAFTVLGERLVRRGVVADVFVVGGAAMALAYGKGWLLSPPERCPCMCSAARQRGGRVAAAQRTLPSIMPASAR